jgi:hypothetical protein
VSNHRKSDNEFEHDMDYLAGVASPTSKENDIFSGNPKRVNYVRQPQPTKNYTQPRGKNAVGVVGGRRKDDSQNEAETV